MRILSVSALCCFGLMGCEGVVDMGQMPEESLVQQESKSASEGSCNPNPQLTFCDLDWNSDGVLDMNDVRFGEDLLRQYPIVAPGDPKFWDFYGDGLFSIGELVTLREIILTFAGNPTGNPLDQDSFAQCDCFNSFLYEPGDACYFDNPDSVHYLDSTGDGSAFNPHKIYTPQALYTVANDVDAFDQHFELCSPLDFTNHYGSAENTPYFTIGGTLPGTEFTGSLDGNGFSITGFVYDDAGPYFMDPSIAPIVDRNGVLLRTDTTKVGLFSHIVFNAEVRDLVMQQATVHVDEGLLANQKTGAIAGHHSGVLDAVAVIGGTIQGRNFVGGLVGFSENGQLKNSSVDGTSVQGYAQVGGAAGRTVGCIVTDGDYDAVVDGTTSIGGVVGFAANYNAYINVDAESTVTGFSSVGGFVGTTEGSGGFDVPAYLNCSAAGEVEAEAFIAGGFAGGAHGSDFMDSHASGGVVSTGTIAGGFVGTLSDSQISDCYANGDVEVAASRGGGFAGEAMAPGTIENSYASGDVTGQVGLGGFIGVHQQSIFVLPTTDLDIEDCHAEGDITAIISQTLGDSEEGIGGFIGSGGSLLHVQRSYASGDLEVSLHPDVTAILYPSGIGGFIGEISPIDDTLIEYSYATGEVANNVDRSPGVGGFVGICDPGSVLGSGQATIRDAYARGAVLSPFETGIGPGGFVGVMTDRCSIATSYATGNALSPVGSGSFASEMTIAGAALIEDSFATGFVVGDDGFPATFTAGTFVNKVFGGTAATALDNDYYLNGNCVAGCEVNGTSTAVVSDFYSQTQAPLNTWVFAPGFWQETDLDMDTIPDDFPSFVAGSSL